MRTTGSRLLRFLALCAFMMLVPGLIQQASAAPSGCATGPHGAHYPGVLLPAQGPGLFAAAVEETQMTEPNPNPDTDNGDWQQRIKHVENRQTLTVIIFLGIVFVILAIWWSWGKIIRRKRRL
jgi:hypothetical protein